MGQTLSLLWVGRPVAALGKGPKSGTVGVISGAQKWYGAWQPDQESASPDQARMTLPEDAS